MPVRVAGSLQVSGTSAYGSQVLLQTASNQLVLGNTANTFTITAPTPAQPTTLTIENPGASCDIQLGIVPTAQITGAVLLTPQQSGNVFFVNQASGPYTITLGPAVPLGQHFRFIVISFGQAAVVTLNCGNGGTTQFYGVISSGGSPYESVTSLAGSANIQFSLQTTGGDWLEVYSGGSKWFVTGMSSFVNAFVPA